MCKNLGFVLQNHSKFGIFGTNLPLENDYLLFSMFYMKLISQICRWSQLNSNHHFA